jgi:regulator of RNase E activity RraA
VNFTPSPAQPTSNSITTNSIIVNTLTPPSGWITYYRIKPATSSTWGNWQSSNTAFTGLNANTAYHVQALFDGSTYTMTDYGVLASASATITTASASANITVSNTTANTITLSSGLTTERWYRLMNATGTSEARGWQYNSGAFTGLIAGTAYQVRFWVTNEVTPTLFNVVTSPAQPTASRSVNTITINTITAPSGWTTQYRIRTGSTGTWGAWQTGNTFAVTAGVSPHQVQARYLATNTTTHASSFESIASTDIATASLESTTAPATRTISSATINTITVNATTAPTGWTTQYRIRIGSTGTWGAWQNSNTFTGLTTGTLYQIQARFAANNISTHVDSAESVASVNFTPSPVQPTSSSATANSITVNALTPPSGWTAYYRIKLSTSSTWENWQTTTVFSGLTSNTVYNVQALYDGGTYTMSDYGVLASTNATITTATAAVAPTITTHPSNQNVEAEQSATFSVVTSGTATLTYQWQLSTDGGTSFNNISGATSASYSIANTTISQNDYMYRCVVSNSIGSATSNAAILKVTQAVVTTQTYIEVLDADGAPGEVVTVEMFLRNNPGIATASLNIEYDASVLSLDGVSSVQRGSALGLMYIAPNIANNPFRVSWFGTENDTGEGLLISVSFRVNTAVTERTTQINVTLDSSHNENGQVVPITIQNANATINIFDFVYGDANGDGVVNLLDAMRIAQWYNGWDVEICEISADANGDGVVNLLDAMRIAQWYNGWDVVLGPQ